MMYSARVVLALAAIALVAGLVTPSEARTITVESPAGVLSNPDSASAGDPFAYDRWMRSNVRNGASVGITGDYPRSGNGSFWFSGPAGAQADIEIRLSSGTRNLLTNLGALQYDWYRSSRSTAPAECHPVIRLLVDRDGDLNTVDDRGYLVYERAQSYNRPAVSDDKWMVEDALVGTFSATGGLVTEGVTYHNIWGWWGYMTEAQLLGVSIGIGPGWDGYFEGAVDNIYMTFGHEAVTFNFEPAAVAPPVPEPVFVQMGALLGLSGVGMLRLRRRA